MQQLLDEVSMSMRGISIRIKMSMSTIIRTESRID
jgi:hypothetical protein